MVLGTGRTNGEDSGGGDRVLNLGCRLLRRRQLLWLVPAILALPGCSRTQTVGEVLANAREYDGRVVEVSGYVGDSMNLLLLKGFTLRDATGSIVVVARGAVPQQGSVARVKGVVRQAFSFGSQTLVVLEEIAD